MTSNAGLLACSNEVLTMIFSDPGLRRRDLKSLRRTSKELCPAATREFAMRYVADPVFALSQHGLQQTSFLVIDTDLVFCASAIPNLDLPMTTSEGLRSLSLPNEALAMICADNILSAKDLAAMRLTNKELHVIATKEFAQRYFRDPFVVMLKGSLETLVEICEHPVFGPHVRKIQLLN
ncbi:hypothetical protein M436DRAFT_36406, partial [Aureobasidium namibiae CBS 147.97]